MDKSKNEDFIKSVKLIRWVLVIVSVILLIGLSGKIGSEILILFLAINIATIIIGKDYKKRN